MPKETAPSIPIDANRLGEITQGAISQIGMEAYFVLCVCPKHGERIEVDAVEFASNIPLLGAVGAVLRQQEAKIAAVLPQGGESSPEKGSASRRDGTG